MRKLFLLFVALLATTCLWAQRFQVGDLFYEIPSEDFTIPAVSSPGAGRTTVVLYVPWNTPAGCYAVGTVNGWSVLNTDLMFTPVEGANSERWVACTFDYAEDMQIKVLALPFDPAIAPSWSYQWGKNMDPENDLVEDNVVILEGAGYLELENQGEPKLVELADNGVVYIEIKDWAANPIIESVPCETAAFRHPWGGGDWVYREAIKTAEGTFELNARYGGMGINVAADIYGYNQAWYPEDQIEFVGDIAQGDSVNFKFISEKSTYVGRMIVTLIEKGTGSYDASWYIPGKNSPTPQQKSSSADSPRQVVVTYQHEWSSDNYYYLTEANIPATVEYNGKTYEVIGISKGAFANSPITSVTIPNSVMSIGESAFAWCDALTSITIPNSVTSIGDYAFSSCSSLTSIAIPNSVTSIGEIAFVECYSLSSIVVESGNATYDSRGNCNAIIETATNTLIVGCQNTIIPNSITSIGDYAFGECFSLTSITIPNSVTSIGEWAFSACESLASVTIGNGVTSIGAAAFSSCSSLTSIAIPNSVTSIGSEAFCGCSSLTSVTIGNSVTSIGEIAFVECYSLSSIVVESGNATYDSRGNCNAIIETATNTLIVGCQNTIIPNSVTSIGDYTFYACSSLTSITIPNSVTSIGEGAFSYCESLTTVICEASNVPVLGEYVFDGMPLSEATLYVPAQSLDDYKAAEQWKDFGTILPLDKAPSAVENTRLPITNSIKLLRNGQVYILQDGKTYTITGQKL